MKIIRNIGPFDPYLCGTALAVSSALWLVAIIVRARENTMAAATVSAVVTIVVALFSVGLSYANAHDGDMEAAAIFAGASLASIIVLVAILLGLAYADLLLQDRMLLMIGRVSGVVAAALGIIAPQASLSS